jgi:hypothetical protein
MRKKPNLIPQIYKEDSSVNRNCTTCTYEKRAKHLKPCMYCIPGENSKWKIRGKKK